MATGPLFAKGEVDLDAYMSRIGYSGPRDATLETLQSLHKLHPQAIAFENLDPLLRRFPVRLDRVSLAEKLVHRRRGGYCFEQNLLFGAVLSTLGFGVTGLSARICWNQADGVRTPRGHMLLKVEAGDVQYIADVGFGALTLTGALSLRSGLEQRTPHERFRLVEREGVYRLDAEINSDWRPVYLFDLQEQVIGDYEMASYYLSSHPDSHFCNSLIAARPFAGGRYTLLNNQLTRYEPGTPPQRTVLTSAAELHDVLASLFDLDLPDGIDDALALVVKPDTSLRRRNPAV